MKGMRLAAALIATLLLSAGGQAALAADPVPPRADLAGVETPPVVPDDPLLTYGGCLAAQHGGDLLLVMDTSGSLSETDPQAARVMAAQYLLDRLAATGSTSGFTLDVAISGFGTDYERVLDWTPLDEAGLGRAKDAVETFRDKDDSLDTDYWTALEGSRQQLADKAAGATRCQAIAWFSDGGMDIEPRTTPKLRARMPHTGAYAPGVDVTTAEGAARAEADAATSMCRPGGLADQLRASGVVILGVGLDGGGSPDFDLMRAVSTGEGASGPCGDLVSPRPGSFTVVTDIDSLLFAFDEYAGPGQDPLVNDGRICQGKVCAEYAHRSVLDSSVTSVDVLGSSDVEIGRAHV